jgi:hypothetical protein
VKNYQLEALRRAGVRRFLSVVNMSKQDSKSEQQWSRQGQSAARGATGDGDTGVPAGEQGISNRPGDADVVPDEDDAVRGPRRALGDEDEEDESEDEGEAQDVDEDEDEDEDKGTLEFCRVSRMSCSQTACEVPRLIGQ